MHRIAEREIRWTITLWLVLVDATGSVQSATSVLAELPTIADTGLMRVPVASRIAGALESVQSLPALGVYSTGSSQALISSFLAVDLGIAVVSRWTRALSLSVDNSALRVEPADTVLQTRIGTDSILAAPFVRLAVVVTMTLQLVALLTRFTLEALWTETHRAMIRYATESVDTTGRAIGGARILALAVYARQGGWTVGVGATTDQTQSSVANVTLRTTVVYIAFDAALPSLTDLSAGTLLLAVAALRAETDLVALAGTVTRDHRFHAGDQSVAVVIGRAAALCHVVHHATTCAFSAGLATFAGILALVVQTGLVAGAGVIAATSNIAKTVLAYLIRHAMIVAVTDCFANTGVASFVAQAISVAPTRGVTGSPVTSLTGGAVQFRGTRQERLFASN